MKLKGKNSKKLKPTTKKKMEDTLKRMEDTRVKDSVNIRAQINAKIVTLKAEKEKAVKYIADFKKKIIEIEEMSLKIDGALVALEEVVKNDSDV